MDVDAPEQSLTENPEQSVPENNVQCGDTELLQNPLTDEQINTWKPLHCSVDDPLNCGPTALKLMYPNIDPIRLQELSNKVERTGITLEEFNKELYENLSHLRIHEVEIDLRSTSFDVLDFFKKNLRSGNITVIGTHRSAADREPNNRLSHENHITTIAKSLHGDIFLFDGQVNMGYKNEDIHKYLEQGNYISILIWCGKHKNKRKTLVLTPENNRPNKTKRTKLA